MSKAYRESKREQARRAYIEALERHLDDAEQYDRDLAQASSPEERSQLMSAFSRRRSRYREDEIAAGRRPRGTSVMLQQNMWARWIEVAVDQELRAVRAFIPLLEGSANSLMDEFHASLLAVTSAAYTIEALYADVKYRVPPPQQRPRARDSQLAGIFCTAFGLTDTTVHGLEAELRWLFELRDLAVHPYTEPALPERHPAGINTGKENSAFNAVVSGRAVGAALRLLDIAANPPAPYGRWIERWAETREPYMRNVVRPLQSRRAQERRPMLGYVDE